MRQEHLGRSKFFFAKHCGGSLAVVAKPTLSPAFPVPLATRLFSTAPECECNAIHTTGTHTTHIVKALSRHFDVIRSFSSRCVVVVVSLFASLLYLLSLVSSFRSLFSVPHSLSSPFSCQQCSAREHERMRERE